MLGCSILYFYTRPREAKEQLVVIEQVHNSYIEQIQNSYRAATEKLKRREDKAKL